MNRKELLQQIAENMQGIYRGMGQRYDHSKGSIPHGQKAALFSIALSENINVKQLAEILHVTSGAATQHIEALFTEGFVERLTDPSDRRNVIVTLSPKGKELIKKLKLKRITMMDDLFQEVKDDELQAFCNVMKKVNEKIIKECGEIKHD